MEHRWNEIDRGKPKNSGGKPVPVPLCGEWRYSSTFSLTSVLDGVGWSTPRPGRFTPGKEIPVPNLQEAGWDPGLLWTGAENVAHTGIRSSDRPARSESLYRVSCPGLHCIFSLA
jgi:hypothetical protein